MCRSPGSPNSAFKHVVPGVQGVLPAQKVAGGTPLAILPFCQSANRLWSVASSTGAGARQGGVTGTHATSSHGFRHCRCHTPPSPGRRPSAAARASGSPQPRGPLPRQPAPAARGVAASRGEEDQPRLWGRTEAGMAALLGRVLRRGVAPLARAAPAQQRRTATSHSENTNTFINEVGPACTQSSQAAMNFFLPPR